MMLAEANADADESHTDRAIAVAQEDIRQRLHLRTRVAGAVVP